MWEIIGTLRGVIEWKLIVNKNKKCEHEKISKVSNRKGRKVGGICITKG